MKTYKKLILAGLIGLASMCTVAFAGNEMLPSDGITMKDGKMTVMKGSKAMALTDTMTLSDGTQVMTDGTVMAPDGRKMMLQEGQTVGMNGQMIAPGTAMDSTMSPSTGPAVTTPMSWPTNSVMMKDGKMLVMKDGKWKKMWMSRTMTNGTKVTSDGAVTMKDGSTSMLKEGDSVSADGSMMKSGM